MLERAFDEALTRDLVTRAEVGATLQRSPHRRGCGLLAELASSAGIVLRITWRQIAHEREVVLVRLGQMMAPSLCARVG